MGLCEWSRGGSLDGRPVSLHSPWQAFRAPATGYKQCWCVSLARQSPLGAHHRCVKRSKRSFLDLLADHPEINRHLDRKQLARLCDPTNYLGEAGEMVDRVLALIDAPSVEKVAILQ